MSYREQWNYIIDNLLSNKHESLQFDISTLKRQTACLHITTRPQEAHVVILMQNDITC